MAAKTEQDFNQFLKRLDQEVMSHRIIHQNHYTRWFKEGELSVDDVRHFVTQFSVFSNLFIVAQLLKTINAYSLHEMREGKEILLNELGVVFKKPGAAAVADKTFDPDAMSTEGSIQGGTFRFEAAHFEWLLNFVKPLGLTFNDVGKRRHGTPSTLHFTDGLARIYGSDDFSVNAGASFGIENWAAAGFWKELIEGLTKFRDQSGLKLNLGFFVYHDRLEGQHASHTLDEAREVFFYDGFNEDKFVKGAQEMLDCCAVFWDGLKAL